MTSYTAILNGEIDPESPITTSLMTKLRDNPIAIAEGATGAPRTSTRAIHPGGSETDGALNDATTITGLGFSDFTTFTRTASLSLPEASVIRVNGDLSLSAAITVGTCDYATWLSADLIGCSRGELGIYDTGPNGGSGGGSIGNGGTSSNLVLGGRGRNASLLRAWSSGRSLVGGPCVRLSDFYLLGGGGGSLVLIVHGNADFTGGSITADGGNSAGSTGGGGGGGGSIIVIATGTITGGTFNARGGNGNHLGGGGYGGGGGGGLVQLVASAFSGTQTTAVTAGTYAGGGANGATAGTASSVTLTEAQINALVTR